MIASNASGASVGHLRILLVCNQLDIRGGVERFVCQLANHLVGGDARVAVATVDTEPEAVRYPLDSRVEVLAGARPGSSKCRSPRSGQGGWRVTQMLGEQWRVAQALSRVISNWPADVLVFNGMATACVVLALHPAWAAKSICCDHNHYSARSRWWQWLRAWIYPRVAAVVSLTEADAPRFRNLNAKTVVIHNTSSLSNSGAVLTSEPIVLAVARLVHQKGIDLLLDAWAVVVAKLPQARLRIVGNGPLLQALHDQAAKLGISHAVEWVGETDKVEREYASAAVFVLPSRYEGMPLVLLEAQAMGLPVVTFDCPTGPAEIVTPSTGIVVPPLDVKALAEALLSLLLQTQQRLHMSQAALKRSRECFAPARQMCEWANLIQLVAAARGASAARKS